jgi:anti-anti-sigma factor
MAPTYSSESQGNDSTIRIGGELDVTACDDLAEMLESFIGGGHRIVLDLSEVTAFDAAALHVILEAATWARDERGRLAIRNPAAVVRATLEAEHELGLLEAGPTGT